MTRGLVCAAVLAVATPAMAQPAADTTEYVVKAGDTCVGIAERELGDRDAYQAIHRANLGMGPLPHVLVAGRVLRLPRRAGAADARIVAASGDVRVQRPVESGWNAAGSGSELFRDWRVAAEDRASARIALTGTKQLVLRDHTTVLVRATTMGAARVTTSAVGLERGAVRTRLVDAAGGGRVALTTPSATIGLAGGSALVAIDSDGGTTVANHGGRAIEVRGGRGGVLTLAAGTASRVAAGAAPAKAHPLLPAPAWVGPPDRLTLAAVGASGAHVAAAWSPVAGAASYRVELDGPGGVPVFTAVVPAATTQIALDGAPAATYRARVAAVDAGGFEGPPGPELVVDVIAVALSTPGDASAAGVTVAPPVDPDAPLRPPASDGSAAPLARVAQGGAIGDAGLSCTSQGATGAPLVVAATGPATIACTTADGFAVVPFTIEVVAVTATAAANGDASGAGPVALVRGGHQVVDIRLDSAVPLGDRWRVEPGPGLTCEGFAANDRGVTIRVAIDGDAPAATTLEILDDATGGRVATLAVAIADPPAVTVDTPAPRPPGTPRGTLGLVRRTRVTAGAFAGWSAFPTGPRNGLELGDAPILAYQVDSGAGAGMRAALWLHRDLFAELEASVWPTGFVGALEPAWVGGGHAMIGVQFARGERVGARAVIGAGAYALLGDAAYARADVDPDVTWGLTGTLRLDRELTLRLDGRQRIAPDRAAAGVTDILEATIGIEAVVGRTSAR